MRNRWVGPWLAVMLGALAAPGVLPAAAEELGLKLVYQSGAAGEIDPCG